MLSFIVNTIHDSDISEVHPDEIELYKDITKQSYIHDVYNYMYKVYNYKFDCPLGVEWKGGTNWGLDNIVEEELYENEPQYE